jgi:UDP-4-amino-4,6-dideoxy-N-acetyl-beta-L-altrosamine transaminase
MIPYGHQDITQTDIDAVVKVLRSDFLTQGPAVPAFEQSVAGHVGAKFAIAVNSGTSALHIACMALGLEKGGRLWTTPNTFVASANCGRYCGAEIDFVDIDPDTWNISVAHLADKLAKAQSANRLPDILVPVHFSGQPTEQEAIWKLAQQYGFRVIEDAAHAIGATHNEEPVGSCRWSDIAIFSFHPVKIITTGEGGMALTNDAGLAEKMVMLRSHGITRDASRWHNAGANQYEPTRQPAAWYYEQQLLGYNYRMTDIHAAIGASQLPRMSAYVKRRNELAQRYDAALRELPLQLPTMMPGNYSAFHLYVVRIKNNAAGKNRRQVFDGLRAREIGANLHYMPVHLQPYYRDLGFREGDFPEAEAYANEAITLPLYATLAESDQDRVIEALKDLLG